MAPSLLPTILVLIRWALSRSHPLRGAGRAGLLIGLSGAIALAERGRRRPGGRGVFPATAALRAPLWLAERALCSWIALVRRLTEGVPYRGRRLTVAAHSTAKLRRRLAASPGEQPTPRHFRSLRVSSK